MKNINLGEYNLSSRMKEHEFDFDPQGWKDLNKKLNKHNPRRSRLWIRTLAVLTLTVSVLSVAWYAPIEPIQDFIEQVISPEPSPRQNNVNIIYPKINVPIEKVETEPEVMSEPEKLHFEKIEKTIGPPELIDMEWQRKELKTSKPLASVESLLEEKMARTIDPVILPVKEKKVKAGLFGGGSVAVSDSPLTPQGAVSPSVGVFVGYNINDKWSVQVEANLKRGFINTSPRKNTERVGSELTSTRSSFERLQANQKVVAKNLTVIEFPILAKYKVNKKHSVMAGVRPSWIQVKDPNSDSNTLATDAGSTMFKKVDVGLSVGYEVQLSEKVALNLRYNQGVKKLFEDVEEDFYNSDFQASVRYTLNP